MIVEPSALPQQLSNLNQFPITNISYFTSIFEQNKDPSMFNSGQIQLRQITMFITRNINRILTKKILTNNIPLFCSTTKILREDDTLSQNDIDLILGNQTSSVQPSDKNKKQSQIVTKEMFYGLVPTKNQKFPECIDPNQDYILNTTNQNIMNSLGITVDHSFDDYCHSLNKFWKQDQLYGSTTTPSQIVPEQLQFHQHLTHDSKYLQQLRSHFVVNLSMPGTIQVQDPRNFMELRPVQQFRHTPIIPIAESTMKKHKQKLAQYHRRQFIFQISQESIISFGMFAVAASICAYMIYLLLQKQEERTVAYTRFKINRKSGSQEIPTFKI